MDPDIDRLIEGFAFLTGSLRQKIEDEFPELTHSIFRKCYGQTILGRYPAVRLLSLSRLKSQSQNAK